MEFAPSEQFSKSEFKDSEEVLRWLRSHEEVVTWDLTDDNFESRTDSHSPDEGTLDWLRGLVHVGKVETSVNDDVTDRFHIDENECPTFLLVPEPPTAIEHVYEYTKEKILDVMTSMPYRFTGLRILVDRRIDSSGEHGRAVLTSNNVMSDPVSRRNLTE
ncbi:hypothetical protein COOONC_05373 [Cooperia oncophora]